MPKTAAHRAPAPRPTTLAPASPPALLAWLFLHGDDQTHAAMARHPNCPLIVLEILAGGDDLRVREDVAHHPRCPATTRETLRERGARE